jgi:TetR/AcrR family transcriptional regulator, transcriptional repressor for nem operon
VPRPRSYRREEALDRAVDAFWTTGYTATSMRSLLSSTGVPPASLYAEFGGKEGLFLAALDRYIDVSRRGYEATLSGDARGLDALRGHFGAYTVEGLARGCLLVNSLGEREEIPPGAMARMDLFFGWVRSQFLRHLELAAAGGRLRPGSDPEVLASLLLALDQGLVVAGKLPSERGRALQGVQALLHLLRADCG